MKIRKNKRIVLSQNIGIEFENQIPIFNRLNYLVSQIEWSDMLNKIL